MSLHAFRLGLGIFHWFLKDRQTGHRGYISILVEIKNGHCVLWFYQMIK